MLKSFARRILSGSESVAVYLLTPTNWILARALRRRVIPNSVLHISYMVHIPHYTVEHLRRQGMRADFLAIGRSPHWSTCDYNLVRSSIPLVSRFQEFWMFWSVVARYEVVHAHFMFSVSEAGWELPLMKQMGRKLIAHFRGCEARDRTRNMALHPEINICQSCEHRPYICQTESALRRRELARSLADVTLVTTPDMRDFIADAIYFPFFAPSIVPRAENARLSRKPGDPLSLVHVTNQPGIEGTAEIEAIIDRLRARGRDIRFLWLRDLRHEEILVALAGADVAIGKMKMGYYANAQIEAMACSVPTITYVRDEFMTDELRNSGFIFATMPQLEAVLERLIDHPEELEEKRRIARASILRIHDNEVLARLLIGIYRGQGCSAPRRPARCE